VHGPRADPQVHSPDTGLGHVANIRHQVPVRNRMATNKNYMNGNVPIFITVCVSKANFFQLSTVHICVMLMPNVLNDTHINIVTLRYVTYKVQTTKKQNIKTNQAES
jgi:hypothetical protein